MPRTFKSMTEMAKYLDGFGGRMNQEMTKALEQVGQDVEATAKGKMGNYQPGIGPFPAWQELAPSTQIERVRLGFTPNDPLLRTGELRDSISHTVNTNIMSVSVGSPLDKALLMERGDPSSGTPPRPFLGPAMWENGLKTMARMFAAVKNALTKG